jgi:hypothetical protein
VVPRVWVAVVMSALVVASCGGSSTEQRAVGAWSVRKARFERPSNTRFPVGAPRVDQIVAVQHGWAALGGFEQGGFAVWTSLDGTTWHLQQYAPVVNGGYISAIVRRDGDLVATGSAEEHPAVWVSRDDGTSWTPLASTAFEPKGAIAGAAVVGDAFAFVGQVGTGNPTPQPAAWWTTDLVAVARAQLAPTNSDQDWMTGVTAIGRRLVAVGAVWPHPAAWSSDDAGRSWQRLDVAAFDAPGDLSDVARVGRHLVAPQLSRSADSGPIWLGDLDGRAWRHLPRDDGSFGDGEDTRVERLVEFRGAVLMTGNAQDRADPNFCYDDIETCDQYHSVLWISSDGAHFARAEMPQAEHTRVVAMATNDRGLLMIGQPSKARRSELDVWQWQGTTQEWGEAPYPREWPVRHDDVEDAPSDYLYGTVRLVDAKHLEVGIEDGRRLRVYEPAAPLTQFCG